MDDLTNKPESLTEALEILDQTSQIRRDFMAGRVRHEMMSLRDLNWRDAEEELKLIAHRAHEKILIESQVQPRRMIGIAVAAGFGVGFLLFRSAGRGDQ